MLMNLTKKKIVMSLLLILLGGLGTVKSLQLFRLDLLAGSFALLVAGIVVITKSSTQNVLTFIAALAISVGLGETLLRIEVFDYIRNGETYFDKESGYIKNYGYTSDIGWLANPGVHTSVKKSINGEDIYNVKYTIGKDGFRVTPENPKKTGRVNFFGCSFTFGEGLNDNQTMPYLFASSNNSWHVKNFGFHGYGVHQALAIMQSNRDTSGEVNFLLTAPWHAERSACKPSYTAFHPRYRLINGMTIRDGVCPLQPTKQETVSDEKFPKFIKESNIYKLLNFKKVNELLTDEDVNLYLELIEEIARISHERGQKFVVGFIKADDEYLKSTKYTNETIHSIIGGNADEVIDMSLTENGKKLEKNTI